MSSRILHSALVGVLLATSLALSACGGGGPAGVDGFFVIITNQWTIESAGEDNGRFLQLNATSPDSALAGSFTGTLEDAGGELGRLTGNWGNNDVAFELTRNNNVRTTYQASVTTHLPKVLSFTGSNQTTLTIRRQ